MRRHINTTIDGIGRCAYRINARDTIIAVDDEWNKLAEHNGLVNLKANSIVGTSVWDYMQGSDIRELYRMMFERIRNGLHTIDVPIRCDEPDVMKEYMLRMEAGDAGSIHVTTMLLHTASRLSIKLLETSHLSHDGVVEMCSFCMRVLVPPNEWIGLETAMSVLRLLQLPQLPSLSHGVCSSCMDNFSERLRTSSRSMPITLSR